MIPDEAAVEEFCERTRSKLVRALTLYCGDRWVAEELAQEALTRCWERWDRLAGVGSLEAWTLRVGMNLANSAFRRRGAERRARQRLPQRATESPESDDVLAVRAAVAALPRRQREALIARYFLDMSVHDAAALLGCAPGTVKAAVAHAIDALRRSSLIRDEDCEVRK